MSEPLTLRTETGDEDLDLSEFEARSRRGEISPQSLVRFPAVTGERFVPACELEIFRSFQEPQRAYFARAFSLARFPWITAALILANLVVYVTSIRGGPLDIDGMVRFGGKAGPLIIDLGELWRLFTANFLHRDALHIGLNMFVLFNVGAALENTYRALDYLWLLVFSGIATMATSLLLADAVSVGASGMVYGCLGGVVVFGLKYRSILPSRYRRVLGEAAIPTVLGLFLIGVRSPGVDNWAHLGGLVAGILCALFMRPKLLADRPKAWWAPLMRGAPSLAVLLCVMFGQALFADWLPLFRIELDDGYGIQVPIPQKWRRGANRLGQLAWYNGLPGLGRAEFAAEAVQTGELVDLAEQAERFVDERLRPGSLGPEVLRVTTEPALPARVAGHEALLLRAIFHEPFGTMHLSAYFVPRGELLYRLVFTWPAEYPRYARVVDQMVAGIRFVEPRSLREARGRALLFPNASWALGALGESLRRQGEARAAIEALRPAVRADPSNALFRWQLALALLQAGQVEEACSVSYSAVLYAPSDPSALEVAARCEVERGDLERALEFLQDAARAAPSDARLKLAEQNLRQALKQPNE